MKSLISFYMYKAIALGVAKGDRTLLQKRDRPNLSASICRHLPQFAVKRKTSRLAYNHKKYKI